MTTTTTAPRRVSQIELARDLGVSDRRIRQLVEQRILPPVHEDGFDLDLCRRRYRLYSNGSERDWGAAFDEAEELAHVASELCDKAYDATAVTADVTAASMAIQASTAMQSFLTACKSKTQSERELFFGIWDREQGQALGSLFARGMELLGATHLLLDDGTRVAVNPTPAPRAKARPAKVRARKGRRR